MKTTLYATKILLITSILLLIGCGGGGNSSSSSPVVTSIKYKISGSINNLSGTGLVLQNDGVDDLTIFSVGQTAFSFASDVVKDSNYNVTISNQPTSLGQVCSVANGFGSVTTDITNIVINCITNISNTYSISGKVINLLGQGLTLKNSINNEQIPVFGKGITNFTFPTTLKKGKNYNIVSSGNTSSPNQICTMTNGVSGVVGTNNVNNVLIVCTTMQYNIQGNISGLKGQGLQIQINDGEILNLANNSSSFKFSLIDDGTAYKIKVINQPKSLSQTCTVTNESGLLVGSNISNVAISCKTTSYKVSGIIKGLKGSGLVIQNENPPPPGIPGSVNIEKISILRSGTKNFEFKTAVLDGQRYQAYIGTQPIAPYQKCSSMNNTGVIKGADAKNIVFNCVNLPTFTVGGRISGLTGSGLVLKINNTDAMTVNATGRAMTNFTFPTGLLDNSSFDVTIAKQPTNPVESCIVQQRNLTAFPFIASANISDIYIHCTKDFSWLNPKPHGETMNNVEWLNGKLYSTSYGGNLRTSIDAQNWTTNNIGSTGFNDIVWTGSQYVAVDNIGVQTSLNGIDWVRQNTGTTQRLYGIVWTNSQLVAVGASGTIITSSDGVTWIVRTSGTINSLGDVVWNGATLIAVGSNGIWASANSGVSWVAVSSGSGFAFSRVVWSGNRFVAVGSTGSIWPLSGYTGTSTDGIIWKFTTPNTLPINGMLDVLWNGSSFVALTVDGNTAKSTDGLSWTGYKQTIQTFKSMTWTGNKIVAVGDSGTVATSTDGITWVSKRTTITNKDIRDIAHFGNKLIAVGGSFVANGSPGQMEQLIMTSSDNAQNWTLQKSNSTTWINKVAWSGITLVVVGPNGLIMSSSDGNSWTTQISGTSSDLRDVIWTGSQFVAVGDVGTVISSLNGVNWTKNNIGITSGVKSVVSNSNTIIVTDGSFLYTSLDSGLMWSQSLLTYNVDKLIWAGSTFVGAGSGGSTIQSNDGLNWSTTNIFVATPPTALGLAWNGSYISLLSTDGKIYVSTDGLSWQETSSLVRSSGAIEWVGDKFLVGGIGGIVRISE